MILKLPKEINRKRFQHSLERIRNVYRIT